jgi:hypothetical protein
MANVKRAAAPNVTRSFYPRDPVAPLPFRPCSRPPQGLEAKGYRLGSARTIRSSGRDETANRDHMNPRTGSDAAEPPSRPSRLNQGLATAKMARDWGVTVSNRSDIV